MKRISWFAGGIVAGAAGSVYAARRIRQTAQALKPVNVARSAVHAVKDRAHDLAEAVREGRVAMHDKEAELRAMRDSSLRAADVVAVRPGQVVVLRSVAPDERGRSRA